MPARHRVLDLAAARREVGDRVFSRRPQPDRVGLEVELLPFLSPEARAPMTATARAIDALAGRDGVLARETADPCCRFPLDGGGAITFEPGGQIEISPPPQNDVTSALRSIDRVAGAVAAACADAGILLVAAGSDVWTDVADVPQQLDTARYRAMSSYLAARSPAGATMMRHTAALQINLDAGTGTTRRERWDVANLVAPSVVGTFACSPGPGYVSLRAATWREVDATRTGIQALGPDPDPVDAVVRAAFDADVLLIRTGDDTAVPGPGGWTFGQWLEEGHPMLGWPTIDDLDYHLTTLFWEVRPRGALELRGIDALPARWRAVPVVLLTGLLYDDRARQEVLRLLDPRRNRIEDDLLRAGRRGVADPELCAIAVEVWSYALAGARRLGPSRVAEGHLDLVERYIDRYTTRGRAPADDLRDLLHDDPVSALQWAAEPVPTGAHA